MFEKQYLQRRRVFGVGLGLEVTEMAENKYFIDSHVCRHNFGKK